MKYAFILKKELRSSLNKKIIAEIEKEFSDEQYEIIKYNPYKEISEVIESLLLAKYTHFIACGGDGTFKLVATQLIGKKATLGIVPIGTANLLSRELNIPNKIDQALKLIKTNNIKKLDGLKTARGYFFIRIDIGKSALLTKETKKTHKDLFGMVAYLFSFINNIFLRDRKYNFSMIINDNIHEKIDAAHISVINVGLLLRNIVLDETISPFDGKFHVMTLKSFKTRNLLKFGTSKILRKKSHKRLSREIHNVTNIYIDTDKPAAIQADGDFIGATPIKIDIAPKCIDVICGL
jgi:diacylglycerol kinase (ATP)